MRRSRAPLLSLLVLSLLGCSTSHPRAAADLESHLRTAVRRVVVLAPDIDVRIRYIGTDEFVRSRRVTELVLQGVIDTTVKELRERGFSVVVLYDQPAEAEFRRIRRYKAALREASDAVVASDPAYHHDVLEAWEVLDASGLPDLPVSGSYDAAFYVWGEAKLETPKETVLRVAKNVGVNVFLASTSFIPAVLPFTLNFSAGFFERSPDDVRVRSVLVDPADGRLLYHNDYHWAAFELFDWEDMTEELVDLPEPEPEPEPEEEGVS